MIPGRPIGVRRGRGSSHMNPPCFLLIAWDAYLTPSRMAANFFKAIQIRVKAGQSTK
jgi:hypothetical protein